VCYTIPACFGSLKHAYSCKLNTHHPMRRFLFLFTIALIAVVTIAKAQTGAESLKVFWPDEYKWKIASNQQNKTARMIELIPGNETLNSWTMIGTMTVMKGVKNMDMSGAMKMIFDKTKSRAPKARLVAIERGGTAKNPWIMFKIESPNFTNSNTPESQMYYVIQGNQSLYTNFIAVKQASLGPLFIEKWARVFKRSKLIYN
jgi:hypothetical protein